MLEVWAVSVFPRALTRPTKQENPQGVPSPVCRIKKSFVLSTKILHLDDNGWQETIKLASEY
jgi:hypothetical protein